MKRLARDSRKSERREEARARSEKWDKLSPEQKLQELDKRLGKDKGAKKQREKLKKILDNNTKM